MDGSGRKEVIKMSFKDYVMERKFFNKRGKVTETLNNLLYEYGEKYGFNMSDEDMKFIEEWNLGETYHAYKFAYDSRNQVI